MMFCVNEYKRAACNVVRNRFLMPPGESAFSNDNRRRHDNAWKFNFNPSQIIIERFSSSSSTSQWNKGER